MRRTLQSPLNLNSLLAAVEAAPPVAAVDVVAAELAEAIGAREVSFLIADFSGWWEVYNAPRRGVELAEQALLASDALAEQARDGEFATGLRARVDLAPRRPPGSSAPVILRRFD